MKIEEYITGKYRHNFAIDKVGLIGIKVTARCKNKAKLQADNDEDLRIEINGTKFREIPPEKNVQLFNIPPAFNGSQLKGLNKTVIFLTVLDKGEHFIDLFPRDVAFVEEIEISNFGEETNIKIDIEKTAEIGDRRPWITFAILDLPISSISTDITTSWHYKDGDDVKLIVDGDVKKSKLSIFYRNWLWSSSVLKKAFGTERQEKMITTSLPQGTHYIEFWADHSPVLHDVSIDISYTESKSEKVASGLIEEHANIIKNVAQEFDIDPVMVAVVIFQEQAVNVNMLDFLADYIGGLLYINTSIGIGQVRVQTAEDLEHIYTELDSYTSDKLLVNKNAVRVERLKDIITNIRYVAAKVHFIMTRWEQAGFSISNKPEIVGTLYNIEDVSNPIGPHNNPESNDFGDGAGKNYDKVKKLLGL